MVNKEIKEKKSRINILDIIIILFVILAGVGIVIRFNLANEIILKSNMDTFEIKFVTESHIQEASMQYFRETVPLFINIENLKIGEITQIIDNGNSADFYSEDLHGNIVKTDLPGRIDVIGMMTSTGKITKDNEYMINGNVFVSPNVQFFVHTGEIEVYIRVISVEKISGDKK